MLLVCALAPTLYYPVYQALSMAWCSSKCLTCVKLFIFIAISCIMGKLILSLLLEGTTPVQFISCVSFLLLPWNTSFMTFLVTKCVWGGVVSPHQAILCDTSGVPYNLIQFWSCLAGDNVRSYGVRAKSHKTVPLPPPIQMLITSPGCHLCFQPNIYKSEVPMIPPWDLMN